METMEEKIGYLTRAVEENKHDVRQVADKVDALSILVNKKFNTAETMINVVKFTGLALGALLTFKFGQIADLWSHFFK